ncbi:hypothetical protein LF41_1573 [Lysobacter dokdonensis DS-58]|uniref:Uncharacterized protein n=1 Tax=Lysobacter dokdonensis DS-58 TaxID=1300345 RepID=A0A0A2WEP3_9GAMM|nr:hypothetical protein LF41_1573 [Lysobacter dokdonensis DS-58]
MAFRFRGGHRLPRRVAAIIPCSPSRREHGIGASSRPAASKA